jgi:hypothetical protein
LISFLNLKQDKKMMLKLVKLVFFLSIYLHLVGCFWYIVIRNDMEWIPPLNYLTGETDLWDSSTGY